MKRLIISLALALVLTVAFAVPIFADTSDDISVTATPAFIAVSVSPDSYNIGGAGAKITKASTYYANPLGATTPPSSTVTDGECEFTITNTSTVDTDITVNFPHFTGGDAMQNSDGGYQDASAGEFGASGYVSGTSWPGDAVILKNSGSDPLIDGLTAETNEKFGWALLTQSDDWSSGTQMSSTVNVAATEDV
jgi:hypothetical protein